MTTLLEDLADLRLVEVVRCDGVIMTWGMVHLPKVSTSSHSAHYHDNIVYYCHLWQK